MMAEPAKLTIRRDFPRPDPATIDVFRGVPTGWVVDAIGRRGALTHSIRPVTRHCQFTGVALTVQTRAMDNLAPYAALRFAKPGDVLVVAASDSDNVSVMGDILLGMARNAGVVAAVTDGLVRDTAGIEAVGIATFARGISPNSPFKDGPGSVGLPISIGGVIVAPGDLLVGDADGVVVVPRERIKEAMRELEAVRTKEAEMDRMVAAGTAFPAWLDDVLERDARFID